MIYPQAVWWPGAAAGYQWGRTSMQSVVAHFTVGSDSAGIGLRGIFNFLVRRNGEVVQFAEADARCGHAGDPYNSRGPGIEVEYLPGVDDTMFTDAQLAACGGLVRWLGTLGIPLVYYDDPANRVGDWNGFISHRSITSNADFHSDYWDQADWDRMVVFDTSQGAAPVYHMITDGPAQGNPRTFKVDGLQILSEIPYSAPRGAYAIHQEALDAQAKYGIPIVDGRVAPPFGTEPLAATVQRYTSGAWKPVGGGGQAVPLKVTLTGTAAP